MKIKEEPGIYCIYNLAKNRYYIGQSKNLAKRIYKHRFYLRKNVHENKYLQNDWNKCTEIAFIFVVIKKCKEEDLISNEQEWIDICFDKQNRCYNIRQKAENSTGLKRTKKQLKIARLAYKKRMKTCTVVSPKGEIFTFTGIRKFCRKRKIKQSAFCSMINGKIPSAQGWRLLENISNKINQTVPKRFKIKLLSPSGEIYKNIFNLENFAKKHSLHASSIRHLIAGRIKSTLGWTIYGRDSAKNMRSGKTHHKSRSCIVNSKKYESISEAEKMNNIKEGLLGRALRNNQKRYRNYEISWYIEG